MFLLYKVILISEVTWIIKAQSKHKQLTISKTPITNHKLRHWHGPSVYKHCSDVVAIFSRTRIK